MKMRQILCRTLPADWESRKRWYDPWRLCDWRQGTPR